MCLMQVICLYLDSAIRDTNFLTLRNALSVAIDSIKKERKFDFPQSLLYSTKSDHDSRRHILKERKLR